MKEIDCTLRFLEFKQPTEIHVDYESVLGRLEEFNALLINKFSISIDDYNKLNNVLRNPADVILDLIMRNPLLNVDGVCEDEYSVENAVKDINEGIKISKLLYPLVSASILKVMIYEKNCLVGIKFTKVKS